MLSPTRARRLHDAQAAVAAANSGSGGRSADAAMAQTAQAAIFTEALIARNDARFRRDQGGGEMRIELLDAAASGMDAQRAALDVAARNVAAAEAAGPNADYARMVPEFRVVDSGDGDVHVDFMGTHSERGTNVDILGRDDRGDERFTRLRV